MASRRAALSGNASLVAIFSIYIVYIFLQIWVIWMKISVMLHKFYATFIGSGEYKGERENKFFLRAGKIFRW